MSLIASLIPVSAAFPSINTHAHGHKHGSHVGSTDDAAGAPGQPAAGAVQNLFSALLQSVERVIGLQSSAVNSATAAGTGAGAVARAASNANAATSTASAGTVSPHSANALLQNYLNNLAHTQPPSGLQIPKPAATSVNA